METANLTIVARVFAKPQRRELVLSELIKLLIPTRSEPGCISYNLHRDNSNENLFLFYEVWENREEWQKHMKGDAIAQYMSATDGSVDEFVINEMTHIDR